MLGMKPAYLVNAHRYLTPEIYKTFKPSFAWYGYSVSDMSTTIKGWERGFYGHTNHKNWNARTLLVVKGRLNVPFVDGVWRWPTKGWFFDPLEMTDADHVMLPTGEIVSIDNDSHKYTPWLQRLTFLLDDDREIFRRQFNAISAILASRFFDLDIVNLLHLDVKLDSEGTKFLTQQGATMFMNCKTCLFRSKCDYYYANSTECRIPVADKGKFAELFGSGDSSQILVGLRQLVQRNALRLESAIEAEDTLDEGLDKNVTALANQVFTQGVALAKLVDPTLRASPKVQVSVNGQNATVTTGEDDPRQFAARAVKELQSHGVPMESITQQLLIDYMAAKQQNNPIAIENVIDNLRAVDARPF